jgi:hypothetical protein
MRQRALPLTAGERQGAPPWVRARAPQRGAFARISGCMGLFGRFFIFSLGRLDALSMEGRRV